MHSRDHWDGTPYGVPMGERVMRLETEVRTIFERELPTLRADQNDQCERLETADADQTEWLEALEARINSLETNELVRGSLWRAALGVIWSPQMGRFIVGAGMLAVAGAKWLNP